MPNNDEIRIVADALGLHPLIAEDIADQNQRAKVETFDDGTVHVVLFALDYAGEASAAEIDFVLGDRYLLTVHDGTLGASKTAPLRSASRRRWRRARTSCSTPSPTRSSTATSVLDQIGDASTSSRTG
jgi:Mg2+ and Co2+ transporter CorA